MALANFRARTLEFRRESGNWSGRNVAFLRFLRSLLFKISARFLQRALFAFAPLLGIARRPELRDVGGRLQPNLMFKII